jgi:hypothetical protein
MLGRPRIDTAAPLRSSISNAAFAVEERVVWGGVDFLRGVVEVAKWPFERAIWAIERGLVWPLEERTGDWSGSLRSAGVAVVAFLAVGAGVLGLLWAAGSGSNATPQTQSASAPAGAPIVTQAPKAQAAATEPVLHGSAPDFKHASGGISAAAGAAAAKAGGEAAGTSAAATAEPPAGASASSSSSLPAAPAKVEPAGPAATKVGHRFADAFVLYEIGRADQKVRSAFAATASPQLAHSLLRRPPRQPANVKVPKAKVLNLVPGPKHGETYTLSVALLRIGVTSELRIDMQRDKKTGEWRVTDARG